MSEIIEDLSLLKNWSILQKWEKKLTLSGWLWIIYTLITLLYGSYFITTSNLTGIDEGIKLLNNFMPLIFSRIILEVILVWRYE